MCMMKEDTGVGALFFQKWRMKKIHFGWFKHKRKLKRPLNLILVVGDVIQMQN
jgi:hypothetical protein